MKKFILFSVALLVNLTAFPAQANHAWANYHWARTSNPFNLTLVDNVSANWDGALLTASSDWSRSAELDTTVVSSGKNNQKKCASAVGKVMVCNSRYGNTNWTGLAQIWVSGDHITKGMVRLNDTYFDTAEYNTPEWRQFVTCQEIGHTLGLDHQDEIRDNPNLGTCMDYTADPTTNQHPNQHDLDQLTTIYTHRDSTTTVGATTTRNPDNSSYEASNQWGRKVKGAEKTHVYERDLGNGEKLITFVIWA